MAISRKGRRRIVVAGRVFYWDYRVEGNKPGKGPIWDWPTDPRPAVVVVASEDKRWRLTFQMDGGYRAQIDPGGKVFRKPPSRPWSPSSTSPTISRRGRVTPAFVRELIELYFRPPA